MWKLNTLAYFQPMIIMSYNSAVTIPRQLMLFCNLLQAIKDFWGQQSSLKSNWWNCTDTIDQTPAFHAKTPCRNGWPLMPWNKRLLYTNST